MPTSPQLGEPTLIQLTVYSRYRFLMGAVFYTIVIHAIALIAMVTLQLGLDMSRHVAERASSISQNPWRWRIGWATWQLTALSDLVVTIGLIRYVSVLSKIRQLPTSTTYFAWMGLTATIAAIVPEQWAEFVLSLKMPILAADLSSGTLSEGTYLERERWAMILTGTCGNTGYTLMSACWISVAVILGGGWRKHFALVAVGVVSIALFAYGPKSNLVQAMRRISILVNQILNNRIPIFKSGFP